MLVKEFLSHKESYVDHFESVARIEDTLIQRGHLIVVDERGVYVGILTPEDVVKKQHNLVIDCLSNVPRINEDDDLEDAVKIMHEENLRVLPVFSPKKEFVGTLQLYYLLETMSKIRSSPGEVTITNIVCSDRVEEAKRLFISQLFHYIRNPLQSILSSAHILSQAKEDDEKKLLMDCIETNVRKVDGLVEQLHDHYRGAE